LQSQEINLIKGNIPSSQFGGLIQQCVFPLIVKVGDEIDVVGSCFAISSNGLICTAAHVLLEANSRAMRRKSAKGGYYSHYEFYALYASNELSDVSGATVGGLIPVDRVWAPEELDIGFGWLRVPRKIHDKSLLPIHSVRIRPIIPDAGMEIFGIGCHSMKASIKKSDDSIIQYSQETAISAGVILDVYPLFRDRGFLSFPCFRTDALFEHGMSGGPIFDHSGSVIGVICSGDTSPGNSYGSLIWPIFGCTIEMKRDKNSKLDRITIYELAKNGIVTTDETFENIQMTGDASGTKKIKHMNMSKVQS